MDWAGVPTGEQERLIRQVAEALQADERVLAAWLVGSIANGTADEFSDVDVHCMVEDRDFGDFVTTAPELLGDAIDAVLVTGIGGVPGGFAAKNSDWQHVDLVVQRRSVPSVKTTPGAALFDRGSLLSASESFTPAGGDPYFPLAVVHWGFYLLGNLPTYLGREEPVLALGGYAQLRDTVLVPLLLAANGHRSTGAKHLRPSLQAEDHQLLTSLRPITASWQSIVAGYGELLELLCERRRRLARVVGDEWPDDVETGVRRHLARQLPKVFV